MLYLQSKISYSGGILIKVGVIGAQGKMGKTVVSAVLNDNELELVCAVDKFNVGFEIAPSIKIQDDIKKALIETKPDIVVDFTQPSSIFENIKTYLDLNVKSVIGTTGLKKEQLEEIEKLSNQKNTGVLIAPNFSIGAVLMMKFATVASKYFDNAEIIEFHHNQKKDAPSGTAIKTAQMMLENKDCFKLGNCDETETIEGSRGGNYESIQIHSVRMPGFVASQEVIFGSDGQTLKIHHDTINRECYMSGVLLAVKYLYSNNNYTYGLENIL